MKHNACTLVAFLSNKFRQKTNQCYSIFHQSVYDTCTLTLVEYVLFVHIQSVSTLCQYVITLPDSLGPLWIACCLAELVRSNLL